MSSTMYYDPSIVMATRNLQAKISQNCPSSRDFSLLWAQITVRCQSWKGVCLIDSFSTENPTKKIGTYKNCLSCRGVHQERVDCIISWKFLNFNPTTTNQRAVGVIKMSLSEKNGLHGFCICYLKVTDGRISLPAPPCTLSVYINCSF